MAAIVQDNLPKLFLERAKPELIDLYKALHVHIRCRKLEKVAHLSNSLPYVSCAPLITENHCEPETRIRKTCLLQDKHNYSRPGRIYRTLDETLSHNGPVSNRHSEHKTLMKYAIQVLTKLGIYSSCGQQLEDAAALFEEPASTKRVMLLLRNIYSVKTASSRKG